MQNLCLRGINEFHDYLFHGEGLPQGVTINGEEKIRDLIISLIKDWRCSMANCDDLAHKNKVFDLFHAYKFWFNPNRLIDTAMSLQRQLAENETTENCKKFSQEMQLLYTQLTTTECLDLYGYFANKDTCYLMRTLTAVAEAQPVSTLPVLDLSEREIVAQVHNTLDCIMEALRDELLNRHITTASYARNKGTKFVKPGRRNLNAVTRIIELYCSHKSLAENHTIEQLFSEVEK